MLLYNAFLDVDHISTLYIFCSFISYSFNFIHIILYYCFSTTSFSPLEQHHLQGLYCTIGSVLLPSRLWEHHLQGLYCTNCSVLLPSRLWEQHICKDYIVLLLQYYFLLAFENTICKDYVTEKVFLQSGGICKCGKTLHPISFRTQTPFLRTYWPPPSLSPFLPLPLFPLPPNLTSLPCSFGPSHLKHDLHLQVFFDIVQKTKHDPKTSWRRIFRYRVFIKYCVFPQILKYSRLWPFSVFSLCQCVYTHQAGRKPALQQNWQSSEKSQNFNEKHNI